MIFVNNMCVCVCSISDIPTPSTLYVCGLVFVLTQKYIYVLCIVFENTWPLPESTNFTPIIVIYHLELFFCYNMTMMYHFLP